MALPFVPRVKTSPVSHFDTNRAALPSRLFHSKASLFRSETHLSSIQKRFTKLQLEHICFGKQDSMET